METINYLRWDSDLLTRHPRSFKYCLAFSMNTAQWERLSLKTVYSMVLANNDTKWVSIQLFGCGRTTRKGHLYHLVFITELLLALPLGHMDHLLNLYCLLCVTNWQENGVRVFWRTCKRRTVILKQHRRLDLVFTLSELKPDSVSSKPFTFWFLM